ncbi:hypothetical protein QJS04_geneDACA024262 [Acorus gramineus]|uniref:Uncharacterized protein n=1 Tax=Acorus gramineus TaxID=55184 RepID=A0AAV8ZZG9_ACOGR|nr:hypothetical protein QJS04_geneDACA024262 [Acorus gramineus]
MGPDITCHKLLPVVITASKDRVPNIKFNVAKVLQALIPIVNQSVVEQTIRPCLVELSEDPDVDVRYFANQALQASDQMMSNRDNLDSLVLCAWTVMGTSHFICIVHIKQLPKLLKDVCLEIDNAVDGNGITNMEDQVCVEPSKGGLIELDIHFSSVEEMWLAGWRLGRNEDRSAAGKTRRSIVPGVAWALWLARNAKIFKVGQRCYVDNTLSEVLGFIKAWGLSIGVKLGTFWREFISTMCAKDCASSKFTLMGSKTLLSKLIWRPDRSSKHFIIKWKLLKLFSSASPNIIVSTVYCRIENVEPLVILASPESHPSSDVD